MPTSFPALRGRSRTSRHRRARLWPALLAILLAAPAAAEIDRYLIDTGPLRIRDQFLPGLGYLGFDPVSADILERGSWQVDLVLTASNTFAHSADIGRLLETHPARQPIGFETLAALAPPDARSGSFYLDGEHERWALAARRGLGRGFQIEVQLPVIRTGGGSLDSTIEGFHDRFSLGQAGRLSVPRDAFRLYLRTSRREIYREEPPGTAVGDAILGFRFGARQAAAAPGGIQLALEGLVKLPTGDVDRLTGSGSADFGAQLLATRYFRGSCLHAALGFAYLGPHQLFDFDAQVVASGMLAWEIALGSRTTGLLQATVSQSPFGELDSAEIGAASTQVTLGVKRVIAGQVLFAGITENIANFNNTADIGLHLGVTRALGSRPRPAGRPGAPSPGGTR